MDEGWIKLGRTFETDGHLDRMPDQALRLYIHFRLAAQWCPGRGLQVGQVRTSYRKLRTKTGYAMKTIAKSLEYLRAAGFITTEQCDAGGPLVVTICDPEPVETASLSEAPAFPGEAPASLSEAPAFPSEAQLQGGAFPSEAGVLSLVKRGASLSEAPTEAKPLQHKESGLPQEGNKNRIHKKDTLSSQSDKPTEKQRPKAERVPAEPKEKTEAQKVASDANYIVQLYDELAKQHGLEGIEDFKAANGVVQKQLKRAGAPRISRDEAEQAVRWAFQHRLKHVSTRGLTGLRDFWSWMQDPMRLSGPNGKGYQPHYTAKAESATPSGWLRKERQAT